MICLKKKRCSLEVCTHVGMLVVVNSFMERPPISSNCDMRPEVIQQVFIVVAATMKVIIVPCFLLE